jgi:hypothetical protein
MTAALRDPRCFAPPNDDPFVAMARGDLSDAPQRAEPASALVAAYRDALHRNDAKSIARSLRSATSAAVHRVLWRALDHAIHAAPAASDAVVVRLFALPLLIVTGGRAGAVVPGAVPDVDAVRRVLEAGAGLGPSRNFAFGNALCALESLRAIPPGRLYALQGQGGEDGSAVLDLEPAPVHTASDEEEVHLRFLAGAGVTAAGAPSFLETGSAIGNWGMALTRELAGQLRVDGVSLLPIPRPPATLLAAQPIGMTAREDLAFQAFVSRTLRRFRSEVGEPDLTLAGLASQGIGVRFSSPFVENRVAVHRRALHAGEDLGEVVQGMLTLLAECGLSNVRLLPEIVDDTRFGQHPSAHGPHC